MDKDGETSVSNQTSTCSRVSKASCAAVQRASRFHVPIFILPNIHFTGLSCQFLRLTPRLGVRAVTLITLRPCDCKEIAFAPAAPETVRTGTGVGE